MKNRVERSVAGLDRPAGLIQNHRQGFEGLPPGHRRRHAPRGQEAASENRQIASRGEPDPPFRDIHRGDKIRISQKPWKAVADTGAKIPIQTGLGMLSFPLESDIARAIAESLRQGR